MKALLYWTLKILTNIVLAAVFVLIFNLLIHNRIIVIVLSIICICTGNEFISPVLKKALKYYPKGFLGSL